jgi:hypothetical protein
MFDNITNKMQKSSFVSAMRSIAAASQVTPFTMSVPTEKVEKIVNADPTLLTVLSVDPANAKNTLVQATTAGLAAVQALPAEEPPVPASAKPSPASYAQVELDDIPESKRGGNKGDSYPFITLGAPIPKLNADGTPMIVSGEQKYKYSSFLVPATDKRPNPAKSLQSTAASASKRAYEGGPRVFVARKAVDPTGKLIGAYVIRTK